ncbi:hypothetical protein GCM10027262_11440 [Nocardia tengchongensis]
MVRVGLLSWRTSESLARRPVSPGGLDSQLAAEWPCYPDLLSLYAPGDAILIGTSTAPARDRNVIGPSAGSCPPAARPHPPSDKGEGLKTVAGPEGDGRKMRTGAMVRLQAEIE